MWNLATASAWSDLIQVTLWRNDGFLHSFCNFSKSNAFGENFIRTKFILHKNFFSNECTFEQENLALCSSIYVEKIEKKNRFCNERDYFEEKGVSSDKT